MEDRNDDGSSGTDCGRCGGSLEVQVVLEHEPCGGVRPRPELAGEDGLRCPDCTDATGGAFHRIGTLDYCETCDERFGHTSGSGVPADPASGGSAERGVDWPWSGGESGPTSNVRKAISMLTVLGLLAASIGGVVAVSPVLSNSPDPAAERSWQSYDAIVVFRNDDIQPYYRRDAMAAVDRIFIEEDVPVTLGVIPAISRHPIAEAGDVCEYLRRRGRNHPDLFEFALHGYTHEKLTEFHYGSEFGGLSYERQLRRIGRGTEMMTECIGHRPTTFIPPMDTYDNGTVRALREQNFTLVSGGGWFTEEYYNESGVFVTGGVRHIPNSKAFVRNWTTYEFFSTAELDRSFDRAYENGSIYVQMIHYPQFNTTERRDRLRSLIAHMKAREDVKFTTLGALDERFREGTIRRTDDGWELLEATAGSDRSEVRYRDVLRDTREWSIRVWADIVDQGHRASVRDAGRAHRTPWRVREHTRFGTRD